MFRVSAGETQESSIRNLVKRAHDPTLIADPTWTQFEGIQGNATTQHIDSNYNASSQGVAYTLNSASIGVYVRNNSLTGIDVGNRTGYNDNMSILNSRTVSQQFSGVINSDSAIGELFPDITDSKGMSIMSRTDNSTVLANKNKTKATISSSSGAIANNNFFELGYNTGNSVSQLTDRQQAIIFYGRGFNQTEMDAIIDACEVYMDSNGKGVIA